MNVLRDLGAPFFCHFFAAHIDTSLMSCCLLVGKVNRFVLNAQLEKPYRLTHVMSRQTTLRFK